MIIVDPTSHVPPYEQVRAQLAEQAASGALPPGHRLPPVRRLAEDLGLAANTVARAYRELEQAGVVQTRGRHGTFVTRRGDALPEARAAADSFARQLAGLGIAREEAVGLASEAIARHIGMA